MKRTNTDHIVIATHRGGAFLCTHCGDEYLPTFPISFGMFGAMSKQFIREHRACAPTPEGERKAEVRRAAPTASVREWLASEDTGISSRTICAVLSGEACLPDFVANFPFDPDDFGRCHRLLDLFPTWRERMGEVAARFPMWGPLVREWPRLTALYLEELPAGSAPKLYDEMQRLIDEGTGRER